MKIKLNSMALNQKENETKNEPAKKGISPVAHFLILLIVTIVTVTVVLALYRPDVLEDIWLWIIGLIGPIIAFVRRSFNSVVSWIKKLEKNT